MNIKTVLHAYNFDLCDVDQLQHWRDLKARLASMGLECFETHGGGSHYRPDLAGPVELETNCLFDNQWNTAATEASNGHRVFDWAKDYPSNLVARGHWIEQTEEMREVRRNNVKCRYCGKMEPAQKGYVFCPHCTDSEYLKESDLHLTRMKAIDDNSDCDPLTEAERAYLLPIYHNAQVNGSSERGKIRIAREREKVEADYKKAIESAKNERDGKRWIMDVVPGLLGNAIYYSHTGRFSFGWRTPLAASVANTLLEKISEFPVDYDIICEDGRKLSS